MNEESLPEVAAPIESEEACAEIEDEEVDKHFRRLLIKYDALWRSLAKL